MLRSVLGTKFARDIKGATLIYVSVMMALLIGMAGVAIDMSRLSTAHTQAQAAADAAALAAARQLDGSVNSFARARAAAENALLVYNSQQFSDEDDASANVQVTLEFLEDIPADDDTPIDPNDYLGDTNAEQRRANFVEATTEILTHENLMLPALGAMMSKRYQTKAIASQDSATCKLTQFAICNPGEVASGNAGFDYTQWKGKLIRVKQKSGGGNGGMAAWAPGNFGYLDPPNLGMGANDLAQFLASVDQNNQCFGTGLNLRTGQVSSTRGALNTRFDIYTNPFFTTPNGNGNGTDPTALYPPAQNVTKGWVPASMGAASPCNLEADIPTGPTQGLPIDDDQKIDSTLRFGNGNWDCLDYWATNHPNDPAALDLLNSTPSIECLDDSNLVSRYEIYKWEIENNAIPGAATSGTNTAPEEGYPQCSNSAPAQNAPYDIETDRRIVRFAVMNCIAEGVSGNVDGVPPIAYMKAFLTQPIDGVDYDVYLEVVDIEEVGTNNGSLKEYVEIYR